MTDNDQPTEAEAQVAVEQGGRWVIAGIHLSPIAQPSRS
jgi:hypothetical protein